VYGKHVFCEKPLGMMSVVEAQAMLKAAEQAEVIHQVGFIFRYGYAVPELRRRVQAGDIGEPYYLRIQYDGWEAWVLAARLSGRTRRLLLARVSCSTSAHTCSTSCGMRPVLWKR
jgi:predicted dehydrogenase